MLLLYSSPRLAAAGRDCEALQEVARRSGVHVLMATGGTEGRASGTVADLAQEYEYELRYLPTAYYTVHTLLHTESSLATPH